MTGLHAHMSPPDACPACAGCGLAGWDEGGCSVPCDTCDGAGSVKLLPPDPPAAVYAACSVDGLIDTGDRLEELVRRLCREWELTDEELAVWRSEEGRGPRLVAVLRPGAPGRPAVLWL